MESFYGEVTKTTQSKSHKSFLAEVEFSLLNPCFYDDEDDDLQMCDVPGSGDVWKKFELLPTPPRSPERDSGIVPEEQLFDGGVADLCSVGGFFDTDNDSIEAVLHRLSADGKSLSASVEEAFSEMKEDEAAVAVDAVLFKDFMWSAPGLEALGFVMPSVTTRRVYDADPLVGAVPTNTTAAKAASTCSAPAFFVDPSQVFDCGDAPIRPGDGNLSEDDDEEDDDDEQTSVTDGDDMDEQDEDDDDEDDEEEIDVVSVQKQKPTAAEHQYNSSVVSASPYTTVIRQCSGSAHTSSAVTVKAAYGGSHPGHAYASTNKQPTVFVKPEPEDVASITSHVAAMHNYSNSSNPLAHHSQSAPQSPSGEFHQSLKYKRVRSWESYPPSPASLLAKRSRPSELRCPAGLLSSHRFKSSSGRNSAVRSCHGGGHNRNPGNKQREMHNVLERKRRDDLRWNFLSLRHLLPQFSSRDRMPKVVILRKSREFIRSLKVSFQKLSEELVTLEARNVELRRQLQDLHDADLTF